jgi:hypothetical protein
MELAGWKVGDVEEEYVVRTVSYVLGEFKSSAYKKYVSWQIFFLARATQWHP